MKTYSITQTYELEVSVMVYVPDNYTPTDVQEHFSDFPISISVESEWDGSDTDEITCDSNICVDGLVSTGLPVVFDHMGVPVI